MAAWSTDQASLERTHVAGTATAKDASLDGKDAARLRETPLDQHPDENQVGLDTRRAFVYYPSDISAVERERIQGDLNKLIVATLRRRRGLSYFQVRELHQGPEREV